MKPIGDAPRKRVTTMTDPQEEIKSDLQMDRWVTKAIQLLALLGYLCINGVLWFHPQLSELDIWVKIGAGLLVPPVITMIVIAGLFVIGVFFYALVKFFSADNFFENDPMDMM